MLNIKFYLALLVLAALLVPGAAVVAADLTYDADVTIDLSDPDINLTIESGSEATEVVVNAGTLVATIPASTTFTVSSPSRNLLTSGNSAATITTSCTAANLAIITVVTGSDAETITFTPAGLQCFSGGSGGGGGGGSPSPAPAPAPSPAPTPTPAPTPSPTPTPTPAPGPTPAPAGAHANGTLILDIDGTIYLIVNGAKRGFRNPEEYMSHGYKFSQAVPASDTDRSLPNEAQAVEKALDGTLALDKTDGRTIYMVANGQKRGFTSADVFFALGYKFSQAVPIDLSDYPAGAVIDSSAPAHPDGALVLDKTDGRTVWWILNGQRKGFQSLEVFNTYGFALGKIVPANDSDMALPEGAVVKFRDGTLVNDNGVYHLISDGMKKRFPHVDNLTLNGYKAANAITADLSTYSDGGVIE